MSERVDQDRKSDENRTSIDVDVYYSCDDCGQEFKSSQDLKEHESSQH